jgi:hypothetical protein
VEVVKPLLILHLGFVRERELDDFAVSVAVVLFCFLSERRIYYTMGTTSSTPSSTGRSSGRSRRHSPDTPADRARKVVGDLQEEFKNSVKKLDDDHPAAQLIDSVCGGYGGYFDGDDRRKHESASFYSEDNSEVGSLRTMSEDDTTYDDRSRGKDTNTVESSSYMSQSDYESEPRRSSSGRRKTSSSFDTEDDSKVNVPDEPPTATLLSKPLASSFAKRCYFTKSGIGKTTQHYEGLTLTGNIVLMLAAAMKLKGCPTICDEDLRRVEQTYPNQFSRLPDELLLSSGWRRISKYCHFSNKPVPDGVPFFRKCGVRALLLRCRLDRASPSPLTHHLFVGSSQIPSSAYIPLGVITFSWQLRLAWFVLLMWNA